MAIDIDSYPLLVTHRAALERFRKSMNLVGPGPVDIHYDDCALAMLPLDADGTWADLGTGAGFPGIVFAALFPTVELDLVESRNKRCWFLRHVLDSHSDLPVHVHQVRHEHLQPAHYDGLMARALHAPHDLLPVADRLLNATGKLLLFLQDDAPTPTSPEFTVVWENRYVVEGKSRRSALLERS